MRWQLDSRVGGLCTSCWGGSSRREGGGGQLWVLGLLCTEFFVLKWKKMSCSIFTEDLISAIAWTNGVPSDRWMGGDCGGLAH